MNKQTITLLYDYNQWANSKILAAASKLTGEQFLADADYPHGGLRGTLTHILFAEWLWRKRMQGDSPAKWIVPEDFPTFEALQARWLAEGAELMSFVQTLADEQRAGTFEYKTTKGVPYKNVTWQVLMHVLNHGTQHRSEAAAMLTSLGHSPGDIDLIVFLRNPS